ncbi:DUF3679 domain-containing protein [Sutcliffiella rhizosphaerae]|uniref:DUF3679 domain-containing protein n=1 Tax=Sutcliffiella rhizosphaerae TaxID=2880967 RepID=A0ABN8A6W6_9BACI|nr:DUF3679 domain-containing protein [Sutcliffiella rhizosphaerae]CAG9619377.1 hypothetical protein BACCIP111883_00144 [Sutcliffiella rhizosphaerae]
MKRNKGILIERGEGAMKRFMLKCLFITFVLFLGVLLGMQQANDGMRKMKGYDDPAFSGEVFHVVEKTENISFLGREYSNQDMQEKQEKLQEMKSYNFLSSTGKKLADGMTGLMSGLFDKAKDTLEEN